MPAFRAAKQRLSSALGLTVGYALLGSCLLLLGDSLIYRMAPPHTQPWLQAAKGALFILGSSALLYAIARRQPLAHEAQAQSVGDATWLERCLAGADQYAWHWDLTADRIRTSPKLASLLGIAETALARSEWLDKVHPDDRERVQAKLQRCLDKALERYHDAYRVRDATGAYRRIAITARQISGDSPVLAGIAAEPVRRSHAELALRQAAAVLEHTRDGVIITDTALRIVSVNRAFSAITGYTQDEALGKTPKLLKSGRHDAAFYQNMWTALRTNDYWQGEIWNRNKRGEIYPEWLSIGAVRDEYGEVVSYVGVFSDITEAKQNAARIDYLTYYDTLTGLPNRALLLNRLTSAAERARRRGTGLAVLAMDLDRLQDVNETFGQQAGDELLIQAAQRLRQQLDTAHLLARLGGDEYCVLLESSSTEEAEAVAESLLHAMAEPFKVAGESIQMSVSIGIAWLAETALSGSDLLRNAEAAMYEAKQEQGSYCVYGPELSEQARTRLQLSQALRLGLERSEFELFYQPQVALHSGKIVGAEALLRWRHPQLGLLLPHRFLPTAEDAGLINEIDAWVLEAATDQVQRWTARGWTLRVGVNVSATLIAEASLVDKVSALLARKGLPPAQLELEVTEGQIMQEPEKAISVLTALRELGVMTAIDDFGTGYSSLSYLKRFPVHRLKIDRSFVRDLHTSPESTAITGAIIALGLSLDLDVIAEGVETKEQEDWLRTHGCAHVQGYRFGRPMPAAEFERLVAAQQQGTAVEGVVG